MPYINSITTNSNVLLNVTTKSVANEATFTYLTNLITYGTSGELGPSYYYGMPFANHNLTNVLDITGNAACATNFNRLVEDVDGVTTW